MQISLCEVAKVKEFVNVAQSKTCEVTLIYGKYVVDAKSILGIFSLDLSNPLTVESEDLSGFEIFAV